MPEFFIACAIDGCDGNAHHTARGRRGWCCAHYGRWVRHGEPCSGREWNGVSLAWLQDTALQHQGDDCLLWPFASLTKKYGIFKHNGERVLAHRWACIQTYGPPPSDKHHAAHSCGCPLCVNPKHLRWATPEENQADRIIHGTANRGEDHPRSKLKEKDVTEILRRVHAGETRASVASDFNLSVSHVGKIALRKSWRVLHEQ